MRRDEYLPTNTYNYTYMIQVPTIIMTSIHIINIRLKQNYT